MRPRLLDLFCCQGGAAMGYHRAGFDVTGVDIKVQPRYPFEFHQADALEYLAEHGRGFDAIHASPPCQSESDLRHCTGVEYVDLLTPTLTAFRELRRPWVIENVASTAKLPGSLILCGSEFGLSAVCRDGARRQLRRHRRFASNVDLWGAGSCNHRGQPIGVYGNGGGGQMTRGYKGNWAEAAEALGIDWMNLLGLSQAIPPAYTEFIGLQLREALEYVDEPRNNTVQGGRL